MTHNWEILTLAQAAAHGLQIHSGHKHSVYRAVLSQSSPANAEKGRLFTYHQPNPDLEKIGHTELLGLLAQLLSEKLIVAMLEIRYRSEKKNIEPVPYFIATTNSEEIRLDAYYQKLMLRSVKAFRQYMAERRWVDRESLQRDFEYDFKGGAADWTYSDGSIFRLSQRLDLKSIQVGPTIEERNLFLKEFEDKLAEEKLIIRIPPVGMFIAKREEIIPRYEFALSYFKEFILPVLRKNSEHRVLKRKLDALRFEEAVHLEEHPDDDHEGVLFDIQRATLFNEYMLNKSGSLRFPGQLTGYTISACAPYVKQLKEIERQRRIEQEYLEYKESMQASDNPAELMVLYREWTKNAVSAGAFEKLQQDPELVSVSRFTESGLVSAVSVRDFRIMHRLAESYSSQKPVAKEKALMLKDMIEAIELDSGVKYSRSIAGPIAGYARLLAAVYGSYIPFYLRWILFLPLPFFHDKIFRQAKEKIAIEQKRRGAKWRKSEIKKEELATARRIALRKKQRVNAVLDMLDSAYYGERLKCPSISEVAGYLELDEQSLTALLNEEQFLIINRPGLPQVASLVFYPHNGNFRTNAVKVLARLNQYESHADIRNNLSREEMVRTELLTDYLKQNKDIGPDGSDSTEDDFSRFEAEIRKLQKGQL